MIAESFPHPGFSTCQDRIQDAHQRKRYLLATADKAVELVLIIDIDSGEALGESIQSLKEVLTTLETIQAEYRILDDQFPEDE